ncbi:MAG: bifunctional sugar-1-phosphate nucleotidylyltransferase/acetyltransferase [Candidatus Hadarchaeota archaeon]
MVLAAGLGTRMRPLTFTKPKFLLSVAGKPALDHVLFLIKQLGVDQLVMVVGFGKDQIMGRYGDGTKFGLKIEYRYQEKLLGTSNALSLAEDFIGGERFLVINGDTLVDQESLASFKKRYQELAKREDFGGLMATIEVDEPEQFGIVFMKGEKVSEIVEKPKRSKSRLANAGIFIFDPAIFDAIKHTKKSARGEYELPTSMQIMIKGGKSIYTSPLQMWTDIGRPWDLLVANEYFLRGMKGEIHGRIEVGANVASNVYVGEGTVIRSGSYILGPTFIGKNCDIGPNCFVRQSTSIGDSVRIGNAVEVKNSIIMDHTNIGHLSYVGDSVVGSNCNLGAGTTIANLRLDEKPVKMEVGGKVVSSGRRKLGTIIADNVKTGINCTINVGVKIGPDSAVGPGTVVYEDILPNTLVFTKPLMRKKLWKGGEKRGEKGE